MASFELLERKNCVADIILLIKGDVKNIFQEMYTATKECNKLNSQILRDFQIKIRSISTWSHDDHVDNYKHLNAKYLDSLLIRLTELNDVIYPHYTFESTDTLTFFHECVLYAAREFFTKPFLYYHRVSKTNLQKNILTIERIIKAQIKYVVRKLPFIRNLQLNIPIITSTIEKAHSVKIENSDKGSETSDHFSDLMKHDRNVSQCSRSIKSEYSDNDSENLSDHAKHDKKAHSIKSEYSDNDSENLGDHAKHDKKARSIKSEYSDNESANLNEHKKYDKVSNHSRSSNSEYSDNDSQKSDHFSDRKRHDTKIAKKHYSKNIYNNEPVKKFQQQEKTVYLTEEVLKENDATESDDSDENEKYMVKKKFNKQIVYNSESDRSDDYAFEEFVRDTESRAPITK
jgi:hypothetical protein